MIGSKKFGRGIDVFVEALEHGQVTTDDALDFLTGMLAARHEQEEEEAKPEAIALVRSKAIKLIDAIARMEARKDVC